MHERPVAEHPDRHAYNKHKALERIIALDPFNEGAYWFRAAGQIAWGGDYEAGISAGEDYFAIFGFDDAEIHTWMGYAYHLLGDLDSAELHYARALRLFGENASPYIFIRAGALHKEIGDEERARELWTQGQVSLGQRLAAYPDNYRARIIEVVRESDEIVLDINLPAGDVGWRSYRAEHLDSLYPSPTPRN